MFHGRLGMRAIETEEEIKENLSTFEDYLCEGSYEEQQFAHDLIRRGSCFVAYQINSELRFSPSRYVGYASNTMQMHNQNDDKDGKETNAAINKIVGYTLNSSEEIEVEYLRFTYELGIEPNNKKRKYWKFNIKGVDFKNNISSDEGFPEGKIIERKHKARERNPKLISAVKEKFISENGKVYCVACGFNFEEKYGDRGNGYIEAHHTIPISEMIVGKKTNIEDIALVCSNCHRILHRTRPWLRMDELKKIIKNKT